MALPAGGRREAPRDEEIALLGERGWLVWEGFLGDELALAAHAQARGMRERGRLEPAAVGHRGRHAHDPSVRGDWTCWLEPHETPGALAEVLAALERLRVELNRAAFLGLVGASVQLACYPGQGERYLRHRDAFADEAAARRLTAIWYLNPAWNRRHGGCLRLHPEGEGRPTDVEPKLDRLLLLLAHRVEHEVRPTWAERWAVTAFFRGPATIPGT